MSRRMHFIQQLLGMSLMILVLLLNWLGNAALMALVPARYCW